jgi:hypothetical protein
MSSWSLALPPSGSSEVAAQVGTTQKALTGSSGNDEYIPVSDHEKIHSWRNGLVGA